MQRRFRKNSTFFNGANFVIIFCRVLTMKIFFLKYPQLSPALRRPEFIDQSILPKKIPHTGDKASLDRCGQQHRCHRRVDQGKLGKKEKTFFARRFQTTSKQKCSNVRPLLSITFPQGFRISKNIGHPTSGSGGTKTVKKDGKPKKTKKSEEKNFFLRGISIQFLNKNAHI